jgi:hypothetical protein
MTAILHLATPARSTIRTVPLDKITIGRTQRVEGVDQRRIDKMAATGFNPDALGLFILSERADGTLVCLDGMHRRALAQQAGYTGHVDAKVFTGLTLAEEAALFILYNDKKNVSAISKFAARVLAGDETAVEINNIVTRLGWTIRISSHPGSLPAVDALERVYRTGAGTVTAGAHPVLTERTLSTLTEAWGHDPLAVQNHMLSGVAQVYGRFGDAVDTVKLVREMQDTQPRVMVGRAKALQHIQGGTVPGALAKILVGMHNHRRRSNLLPEWVWTR